MSQTDQTFARLNTDDADVTRPSSDFVAATNIALEPGGVRPARGNVLVPYALPTDGTNKRLGGFPDGATGTGVTLLYNSAGHHRIIRYDKAANGGAGSETTLLEWSGLNLSVDLVPQGGLLDGLLGFLDGNDVPRIINLARAAAGEYTPQLLAADPTALHLARRTPALVLQAIRLRNDDTADPRSKMNQTADKAWQFAYLYGYRDDERTPLSPFSSELFVTKRRFFPYNQSSEFFNGVPVLPRDNFIRISIPTAERISPLVKYIEVYCRANNDVPWTLVTTLRRPAGEGDFIRVFDFYGTTTGIVLPADEATKEREAIPLRAAAMTAAASRFMFGGVVEGFVAPSRVNLVLTPSSVPVGAIEVLVWDLVRKSGAVLVTYNTYLLLSNGLYQELFPSPLIEGLYEEDSGIGPIGTFPPQQYTAAQILTPQTGDAPGYPQLLPRTGANYRTVSNINMFDSEPTFIGGGVYTVATTYYDAAGQTCGAADPIVFTVPPQPAQITSHIPDSNDNHSRQVRRIAWQLAAASPQLLNAEIPAWAESYQLVVSKEQTRSFFLQTNASDILYFHNYTGPPPAVSSANAAVAPVRPAALERMFVFNTAGNHYGANRNIPERPGYSIFVDIGGLPTAPDHIGYVWQAGSGDRIRFKEDVVDVEIQGQNGDYLLATWPNGSFVAHPYQEIEIYSPAAQSENQPLYENGLRYPVVRTLVNGVEQRSYSVTSGYLVEDAHIALRWLYGIQQVGSGATSFSESGDTTDGDTPIYHLASPTAKRYVVKDLRPVESMNPDAPRYAQWLHGRGRPTLYVSDGSKQVRRSKLIRFTGLKVQGTQLNNLSRAETLDQYDGLPQEQGAITAMAVADQTQTDGSILLVTQERGASSVQLGRGQISTADGQDLLTITHSVIGSSNTLRGGYGCTDPGSLVPYAGKVFYFCRERTELIRYDRNGPTPLALTHKARTLLGDTARLYEAARVTACFNPHIDRKELCLTFHAVGILPGITLVYSDLYEAWSGALAFVPEAGLALGDELLTFHSGQLWRHAVDAPASTFFGAFTSASVTYTSAQPGGRLNKLWRAIAVHSQSRWLPTRLANADGQASRILPAWLTYAGGIWRAAIRRDENTPGAGTPGRKLHGGNELQSAALEVTLTAGAGTDDLLTASSLEFTALPGQQPVS